MFVAPDWRDASAYADPNKETRLPFWAWEFLRRNEGYQKTWLEYAQGLRAMAQRLPQLSAYVDRAVIARGLKDTSKTDPELDESLCSLATQQAECLHASPPRQPGEDITEWAARVSGEGQPAQLRPMEIFLAEKWGLKEIINPAEDYSAHSFQRVQFVNDGRTLTQSVPGAASASGRKWPGAGDPNHPLTGNLVSICFDLRLPEATLRAQFDAVLRMREKRIAKGNFFPYKGRPEKSLPFFRHYIRTLDGLADGASLAEIAAQILPHQDSEGARKTVGNWKTKAQKIRDGEYAALPAFAPIVKKR